MKYQSLRNFAEVIKEKIYAQGKWFTNKPYTKFQYMVCVLLQRAKSDWMP